MQGYNADAAKLFILNGLDAKKFKSIANLLDKIIGDFITYDLHFMRLTGVLNEEGEQGEGEYDDDEAFEYIYDAWLSDNPENDDEDMRIAELLNRYMELQNAFLIQEGLAEV